MKHSIRGTVGSDGNASAFLITDMETGASKILVEIAVDAAVPTSQAQFVEKKWEQITALRWEFGKRLREVLSAS